MRNLLALGLALTASIARGADLSVAVVDALERPLPGAVVYLTGAGLAPRADPPVVVIDQKNKQFEPRISVIPAGTSVTFPNSDQIRHSVYSFSPAKTFSLKLYSGKPASPVVFDKPGLVVLGCNIHDKMAAWLFVVDTSAYAQAGANGQAVLRNISPGSYMLYVWYPGVDDGPVAQKITVAAQDAPLRRVHLEVRPIGEVLP